MNGFDSGELDRYPSVASFYDLDRSVEILTCKLQRQKFSVLTREYKASALEERMFCTGS